MTTHTSFAEALASQTEMGWTPQQARAAFIAALHGYRPSNVVVLPVLIKVQRNVSNADRARLDAVLERKQAAG